MCNCGCMEILARNVNEATERRLLTEKNASKAAILEVLREMRLDHARRQARRVRFVP